MEELPQCPPPMIGARSELERAMMNHGTISESRCAKEAEKSLPKEIQHLIALKRYEIRVRFLDHGMVIDVGCKSFAFSSVEDGMANLQAYTENPVHVQKTWLEKIEY